MTKSERRYLLIGAKALQCAENGEPINFTQLNEYLAQFSLGFSINQHVAQCCKYAYNYWLNREEGDKETKSMTSYKISHAFVNQQDFYSWNKDEPVAINNSE